MRAYWSDDILEEVRRNLVEQGLTSEEGAARRIAAMRHAFSSATIARVTYEGRIDAMPNDPGDRHVLAAAVAAAAQVIVTSNLRHFPNDALVPFSIEAQSPDEFLSNLLDLDAEIIVRIIREQAADLQNPPKSVEEVLDAIAHHAPDFATIVRGLHHRLPR